LDKYFERFAFSLIKVGKTQFLSSQTAVCSTVDLAHGKKCKETNVADYNYVSRILS
jgi:hypothetical protein